MLSPLRVCVCVCVPPIKKKVSRTTSRNSSCAPACRSSRLCIDATSARKMHRDSGEADGEEQGERESHIEREREREKERVKREAGLGGVKKEESRRWWKGVKHGTRRRGRIKCKAREGAREAEKGHEVGTRRVQRFTWRKERERERERKDKGERQGACASYRTDTKMHPRRAALPREQLFFLSFFLPSFSLFFPFRLALAPTPHVYLRLMRIKGTSDTQEYRGGAACRKCKQSAFTAKPDDHRGPQGGLTYPHAPLAYRARHNLTDLIRRREVQRRCYANGKNAARPFVPLASVQVGKRARVECTWHLAPKAGAAFVKCNVRDICSSSSRRGSSSSLTLELNYVYRT